MRYLLLIGAVIVVAIVAVAVRARARTKAAAGTDGDDAPIATFWRWFAKNAAALHGDPDLVGVMNKASSQIQKIDGDLICELAVDKDVRTLVISADGKRRAFPLVQAVYDARPQVAGWKFMAFRQPMPAAQIAGMRIKMNDVAYAPADVRFVARRDGDKLDVLLFSPSEDVSDPVKQILYVMLDHVVGEYATETRIGGIDFRPRSETAPLAQPLPALKQVLDTAFPPPN